MGTALRRAWPGDVPALVGLIEASVRRLSEGYYQTEDVDLALRHIFGPDTQLIQDGTYHVITSDDGLLVAAGGWSRRRTLYGGDQMKAADDPLLDPAVDPARIRAFFVHPDWTRRGLGRRLYERCRREAEAEGFRTFELMATLPGEPLYRALGFVEVERAVAPMPGGRALPVVRMRREIDRGGET